MIWLRFTLRMVLLCTIEISVLFLGSELRSTKRFEKLFAHFNNGVTMLAEIIEFRGAKKEKKTLNLRGISVVNGAQTIATSARFKDENKAHDTSAAKVLLTII